MCEGSCHRWRVKTGGRRARGDERIFHTRAATTHLYLQNSAKAAFSQLPGGVSMGALSSRGRVGPCTALLLFLTAAATVTSARRGGSGGGGRNGRPGGGTGAHTDPVLEAHAAALGALAGDIVIYRNGNVTGEAPYILRASNGDMWTRLAGPAATSALYDAVGVKVKSREDASAAKVVFAYDKSHEHWIHPSIAVGHRRKITLPVSVFYDQDDPKNKDKMRSKAAFELETLGNRPRVLQVKNFLSPSEVPKRSLPSHTAVARRRHRPHLPPAAARRCRQIDARAGAE